jgi:hypothetical protein
MQLARRGACESERHIARCNPIRGIVDKHIQHGQVSAAVRIGCPYGSRAAGTGFRRMKKSGASRALIVRSVQVRSTGRRDAVVVVQLRELRVEVFHKQPTLRSVVDTETLPVQTLHPVSSIARVIRFVPTFPGHSPPSSRLVGQLPVLARSASSQRASD